MSRTADYLEGYRDYSNARITSLKPSRSKPYRDGWFDAKDGNPRKPPKDAAPARKKKRAVAPKKAKKKKAIKKKSSALRGLLRTFGIK